MSTFSFRQYGGYKVTIDKNDVTISYAGEKLLFFQKSKPRELTFSLNDIIRVDYKESTTMAFGYVRFVTQKMDEYVSSSYMARHDQYSFIVDKDEIPLMNEFLSLVNKAAPKLPIVKSKN